MHVSSRPPRPSPSGQHGVGVPLHQDPHPGARQNIGAVIDNRGFMDALSVKMGLVGIDESWWFTE
jgi:hypothetical protein